MNDITPRASLFDARSFFESIHGDVYLWRIGEITAEKALEGIDAWMTSVESGAGSALSPPGEPLLVEPQRLSPPPTESHVAKP